MNKYFGNPSGGRGDRQAGPGDSLAELYEAEGWSLSAAERELLGKIAVACGEDFSWLPSTEGWYTKAGSSVGDFPAYVLIRCPVARMWGRVTEEMEDYRDEPFDGAHPVLRRSHYLAESQWSTLLEILGSSPVTIGLWEGYGGLTAEEHPSWTIRVGEALGLRRGSDLPLRMSRLPAALLATEPILTPDRAFYVLRSTLPAFHDFLSWREANPAVCFPDLVEAKEWRAACDVDAACVVIGCSPELAERLVASPGLWAQRVAGSDPILTCFDEGTEDDPIEGEDVAEP
ncbi:MAG: hypothetical protein Q4P33_05400 [Flaviflexus sp.]|nr:hypothetical protein [Flaviflexus sp.]